MPEAQLRRCKGNEYSPNIYDKVPHGKAFSSNEGKPTILTKCYFCAGKVSLSFFSLVARLLCNVTYRNLFIDTCPQKLRNRSRGYTQWIFCYRFNTYFEKETLNIYLLYSTLKFVLEKTDSKYFLVSYSADDYSKMFMHF